MTTQPPLTYRVFERTTASAGRGRKRFYARQALLGFAPVKASWAARLHAHGLSIELIRPVVPEGATAHSHKKMVLVPIRCAEIIHAHVHAREKHPGSEPLLANLAADTIARLAVEAWRATTATPPITAATTLTTDFLSLQQLVNQMGGVATILRQANERK